MKKLLTIFLALALAGCGVKVKTDEVKVKPIDVYHHVEVNAEQLSTFFTSYCESHYTTQEEIDQCVAESVALFWQALQQSTPSGSVQPSQQQSN